MTAGYRDFRPRDEDPDDHAAVAAMQARSEAVKADTAFRQAMLAAIAAGQECAPTAVSTVVGAKVPSPLVASNERVRSDVQHTAPFKGITVSPTSHAE
jgi:hypothetical protein